MRGFFVPFFADGCLPRTEHRILRKNTARHPCPALDNHSLPIDPTLLAPLVKRQYNKGSSAFASRKNGSMPLHLSVVRNRLPAQIFLFAHRFINESNCSASSGHCRFFARRFTSMAALILLPWLASAQAPTSLQYSSATVANTNVSTLFLSPTVAGNVTSYSITQVAHLAGHATLHRTAACIGCRSPTRRA